MSIFLSPPSAQSAAQALTPQQQLRRAINVSQHASSTPSCTAEVNIGIFFDGTNNNKKRDQEDVSDPDARSHSNVVVLYDCFADKRKAHYRIYVPGVGTAFPEVGERTESREGKSMGVGGDSRIYWAMIQVINAIHRGATKAPLVQDDEAKALIIGPSFLGGGCLAGQSRGRRQGVFDALGQRLAKNLKDSRPTLCQATLSVFGFSRGAAEARAFCNWMLELCKPGAAGPLFYGVALRFRFLGLFDTVASAGIAHSAPVPNDGGFMGWADGTLELPGAIERCVHFTAAHEIRKSFPLSTARHSECAVQEVLYPGAHSDVGGGYAPGEQGKGRCRAELLSQVALIHMYQLAREAGVPLADARELERMGRDTTIRDLNISPSLVARFNEYRRVGPGGGEIRQAMREHLRWYWRWRLAVGGRFESLSSFQAAPPQDKEDLAASEMDFRRDLAQAERDAVALAQRRAHPLATPFVDVATVAQQGVLKTLKEFPVLSAAEQIALAEMRARVPLPAAVAEFFDQHLHDSHASFYLVGPLSAYERQQMIASVARKQQEGCPLNGFERRVAALQLIRPGAYPPMRDADYDALLDMDGYRSKLVIKWMGMSATRRESDGHVRERVVFDHS